MTTNSTQDALLSFFQGLNNNYLGPLLIILLIGTGLYFTIRLGFIQRFLGRAIKQTFTGMGKHGKASKEQGMSPFQALSTAVAAQLGTGNIVGIATAIVMGGPGAVLWLWISIALGMATNYAEAVLAQLFRSKTAEDHVVGGPAYYISRGVKSKFLANIFAIVAVFALGFMGTMVQTNSITMTMGNIIPVHPIFIGIPLAILVGIILIGGITRIASFAEKIVPFMAVIYFTAGIILIAMHYENIIPAFKTIFECAFTGKSVGGGAIGYSVILAIRYGVSRGLFSNEAGLGTTPHAHAVAKVKQPYEQGLSAMVGVATNLIICTLSALIVLVATPNIGDATFNAVQESFTTAFGQAGNYFVAITLFCFSLTTIVGWYFFAAQNLRFLCGEKLINPFRLTVVLFVIIGSVLQIELVWELMDTFNVFLVIPNVIALLYLSPKIIEQTKLMRENGRL